MSFTFTSIKLFEYEERGTPKAYRIGRQYAIDHGQDVEEFEILFRKRFVYAGRNPQV